MVDWGEIARKEKNQRKFVAYQCYNLIIGWTALITGAIFLNTAEVDCPWSPTLPTFLVAFGVVSNCSFLVTLLLTCCSSEKKKACACWLIRIICFFLVVSIGFTSWGFVLLYLRSEDVTFKELKRNSTVVNENYCNHSVYLVKIVVTWMSAAGYIFVAVFSLFAVFCAMCRSGKNNKKDNASKKEKKNSLLAKGTNKEDI